ncbi:MAG: thiaminase II [Chloroflexi bacterium]|nr:thiaminase II [Chloroflexota bacterium]
MPPEKSRNANDRLSGRAGRGFSDQLRASCEVDWRRAHEEHPFVQAMGDGSLSLARFSSYMRQDYLFLIDYCRALAIASAKSPDLASMGHFAGLLDETLNSEMELHRGFCSDLGITAAELEATNPEAATVAYTDHLLRTAYDGSIEELAAALLPCQWGYDAVGRLLEHRDRPDPDSFHSRWVAGYCAPEYRKLTEWLKGFVDEIGAVAPAEKRRRMQGAFRASTRYEYLFWDAAWGG